MATPERLTTPPTRNPREEPQLTKAMMAKPAATRAVARPLRVLVPLVKEDLESAATAGLPFYIAAGEKLLEAKT